MSTKNRTKTPIFFNKNFPTDKVRELLSLNYLFIQSIIHVPFFAFFPQIHALFALSPVAFVRVQKLLHP